jgi:hypothetical protein
VPPKESLSQSIPSSWSVFLADISLIMKLTVDDSHKLAQVIHEKGQESETMREEMTNEREG